MVTLKSNLETVDNYSTVASVGRNNSNARLTSSARKLAGLVLGFVVQFPQVPGFTPVRGGLVSYRIVLP